MNTISLKAPRAILIKTIFALAGLSTFVLPHAHAGTNSSGGGDVCENRIKVIRDDLKDWIAKGGPSGLTLPKQYTVNQYSMDMLKQMASASVQCVGSSDTNFPITIDGTPKICKFVRKHAKASILCDFGKFQSISEADQYTLIHHEFAGLAGVEKPNGADSSYTVSNQISEFLVSTVVKRLAVKPGAKLEDELVTVKVRAFVVWASNPNMQPIAGSQGTELTPYTIKLHLNPTTQKFSGVQKISVPVKDVIFDFFIQIERNKEGYVYYFWYHENLGDKTIGWENLSSLFNLPTPQAPTMHLQGKIIQLPQESSGRGLWLMPVVNVNGTLH
jgi:hypothetical protein